MIVDLKIKKYVKLLIAPHDVRKAHNKMVYMYNQLSADRKVEFIEDLDKEIVKLQKGIDNE